MTKKDVATAAGVLWVAYEEYLARHPGHEEAIEHQEMMDSGIAWLIRAITKEEDAEKEAQL